MEEEEGTGLRIKSRQHDLITNTSTQPLIIVSVRVGSILAALTYHIATAGVY